MTVCFYHVTYALNEPTLCNCQYVKEPLAGKRAEKFFDIQAIKEFRLKSLNAHMTRQQEAVEHIMSSYICYNQGRSEGTSSVAFKVLIIKSEIDFINLFIFNCLTSNINLFNFNCLTSNFCFPKNIFFASRRERMFMDARP